MTMLSVGGGLDGDGFGGLGGWGAGGLGGDEAVGLVVDDLGDAIYIGSEVGSGMGFARFWGGRTVAGGSVGRKAVRTWRV